MSDTNTRRAFSFPVKALLIEADRFQKALDDAQVGPPVTDHFAPTFLTDLDSQITLVKRMMTDRDDAKGAVGVLVTNQDDALTEYNERASSLRTIARLTFPNQPVLLHSAFGVGTPVSTDFATILAGAHQLLNSCAKYADELSQKGWSPAMTTTLTAMVEALQNARTTQHVASDGKERLTSQQADAANGLYRQLRAIQAVARAVYPKSKQAKDPTISGARAMYLLGEWPPRRAKSATDATGGNTGPTGTTPTSGTGGNTGTTTPGSTPQ